MPVHRYTTGPSSNVNGWEHYDQTTLALALQPDRIQQKKRSKHNQQQEERGRAKRPSDEDYDDEPQQTRDNEKKSGKGRVPGAGLGIDGASVEVDGWDMDGKPADGEDQEDEKEDGENGQEREEEEKAEEENGRRKQSEDGLTRFDRTRRGPLPPPPPPPRTTLSTLSFVQPYLTPAISPPGPGPVPSKYWLGPPPGPHQHMPSPPYHSLSPSSTSSPNNVPTRDQRNRAAATRYRTKSKAALASLEQLEQELSSRRQELLLTVKDLEQEKYELKTALLRHGTCPGCACQMIKDYLDQEAKRIVLKGREKSDKERSMIERKETETEGKDSRVVILGGPESKHPKVVVGVLDLGATGTGKL